MIHPSTAFLFLVAVSIWGASPANACTCEAEPPPLSLEDLEPFDLIFSGVPRVEKRGGHRCGSTEDSLAAFEVETKTVWRGELSRREIVVVPQDSCSPVVLLDDERIFVAERQSDGTAFFRGLVCSHQPGPDELSQLLGEPSTTDRESATPECFPSCASTAAAPARLGAVLLLGLWSVMRRPRR